MKTYAMACHICGAVHEVQAHFLSSPLAIRHSSGWTVPAASCGAHKSEEIRRAYLNGTSPEALARFESEWTAYQSASPATRSGR